MQPRAHQDSKGSRKFFRIVLGHTDLFAYYNMNFLLMHRYNFRLSEIEDMIPFERDVYISLLENYIEEKRKREDRS